MENIGKKKEGYTQNEYTPFIYIQGLFSSFKEVCNPLTEEVPKYPSAPSAPTLNPCSIKKF